MVKCINAHIQHLSKTQTDERWDDETKYWVDDGIFYLKKVLG